MSARATPPARRRLLRARRLALPTLFALASVGCGTGTPSVDGDGGDGSGATGTDTSAPSLGAATETPMASVPSGPVPGTGTESGSAGGGATDGDTGGGSGGGAGGDSGDGGGTGAGTDGGSGDGGGSGGDDGGTGGGSGGGTDGGSGDGGTDDGSGGGTDSGGSGGTTGGTTGGSADGSGGSGGGTDGGATDGGPLACDAASAAIRERALTLINAVRAEARSCGNEVFDAAAPLGWDDRLQAAAAAHSADMATHNFFSHTGSDGSSVADRVDAAGYDWSRVGENIAAGQRSVAEAIDGWVTSPGHCRNLMNPGYTAVSLACVEDDGADYRTYWTNVLARPR